MYKHNAGIKMIDKQPTGIVLYTDGGCRPNPGYGGWGIHGYMFNFAKTAKGIGHTTHNATVRGYVAKSDMKGGDNKLDFDSYNKLSFDEKCLAMVGSVERPVPVQVTTFIDSFGTMEGINNTNYTAEICAAIQAFSIAIEKKADVLIIRADAEVVVKGITLWMDNWSNNNWIKKNGAMVSNHELWQELLTARNLFKLTGGNFYIEWVKAHDEDIGNLSADWLATLAVFAAKKGTVLTRTDYTEATSEYWGSASDKRHALLNYRYAYFLACKNTPKSTTYYLGNQGKEPDLIGKKTSDASYAVVQIDEGSPILDFVIEHQKSLGNELTSMCTIDLNNLYGPSYRYTNLYKDAFLYNPVSHRYDLHAIDEAPITRELRPPVIAERALDAMIIYTSVLEDYLAQGEVKPISTDITDIIYSTVVTEAKGNKEAKTEYKVRPEMVVGLTHIKAKSNVLGLADKIELTLTCGIDIPDRNTLKRIESLNPKVSVITWGNDPLSFHYATVIEADGCRGIWAGAFSNLRVLETPRVF